MLDHILCRFSGVSEDLSQDNNEKKKTFLPKAKETWKSRTLQQQQQQQRHQSIHTTKIVTYEMQRNKLDSHTKRWMRCNCFVWNEMTHKTSFGNGNAHKCTKWKHQSESETGACARVRPRLITNERFAFWIRVDRSARKIHGKHNKKARETREKNNKKNRYGKVDALVNESGRNRCCRRRRRLDWEAFFSSFPFRCYLNDDCCLSAFAWSVIVWIYISDK